MIGDRLLALARPSARKPQAGRPVEGEELAEAQRLAQLGSWRWDIGADTVQWSPTLFEIFGLDPSGPVPSYAEHPRIYSPESFMRLDAAVHEAISTGKPYTLDLEIRHPSGEPRWITGRGEAIRDGQGRIIALRGTAIDITERHRLLHTLAAREQALQLSERRFRASFNSMHHFMAVLAPDGRLLEVNETTAAFTGGPAADQIGKPFWEAYWWRISAATRDGIRDAVARAAAGEFVRYDVDVLDTRDQRVTVDFSIKPVYDDAGQLILLIPEGRDVTEERRARTELADSERQFRLAMRDAPIGTALVALDGRWLSVNELLCRMLGRTEAELQTMTFQDVTHPDDLAKDLDHVQDLLNGTRDRYQMAKRYLHADGSIVNAQLHVSLLRDTSGKPLYYISQVEDFTSRRAMEAHREALSQRLSMALRVSGIGVWEWDFASNLLTWDAALKRLYGVAPDTIIDYQTWRSAVVAEDLLRCEPTLQAAIRDQTQGAIEFRIIHPKLGLRFIESLFGVDVDANGKSTRMVGVNLDVTERWLAEQRISETHRLLEQRMAEVSKLQELLQEQAIRDGLTGLYNRRYFDERLALELEKATVEGEGLSLMMADLDHFKHINDRFGHPCGDALLQAWSALLRAALRGTDVRCRYGGEEFAVLLPHSSLADAAIRAEQLRSSFEALSLMAPDGVQCIRTTVSIGVAHAVAGGRTAGELILAADESLYRAKNRGRNRVVCETESSD